jgi:hypothetical protein
MSGKKLKNDIPYKLGDLIAFEIELSNNQETILYGYIASVILNDVFVYFFEFDKYYCLEGREYGNSWRVL